MAESESRHSYYRLLETTVLQLYRILSTASQYRVLVQDGPSDGSEIGCEKPAWRTPCSGSSAAQQASPRLALR
jgi:hypothetical protein